MSGHDGDVVDASHSRPPSAAAPDGLFYSPPSSLSVVVEAWWGHLKYIIVGCTFLAVTLYSIMYSMKAKCAQGLTRDVFETEGQSEVRYTEESTLSHLIIIRIIFTVRT